MIAALFSFALAAVFALHAHAESHTVRFKNNCGTGTPQLIQGGNVLSNGSDYTSNGPLQSSIAYLQTGGCLFNGEFCTLVEMNLNNPACAGCGSSVDISLIPTHEYNVETAFTFFGGDGDACDGLGAVCADTNCDTAFFQSNDNQVQRACQADNVNLLITFCGGGATEFTEAVAGSLSEEDTPSSSSSSSSSTTVKASSITSSSTSVRTSSISATSSVAKSSVTSSSSAKPSTTSSSSAKPSTTSSSLSRVTVSATSIFSSSSSPAAATSSFIDSSSSSSSSPAVCGQASSSAAPVLSASPSSKAAEPAPTATFIESPIACPASKTAVLNVGESTSVDSSSAPTPSTSAISSSSPSAAAADPSTTKTCKRRRSRRAEIERTTSFAKHARSQRRARAFSGAHGTF